MLARFGVSSTRHRSLAGLSSRPSPAPVCLCPEPDRATRSLQSPGRLLVERVSQSPFCRPSPSYRARPPPVTAGSSANPVHRHLVMASAVPRPITDKAHCPYPRPSRHPSRPPAWRDESCTRAGPPQPQFSDRVDGLTAACPHHSKNSGSPSLAGPRPGRSGAPAPRSRAAVLFHPSGVGPLAGSKRTRT